MNTKTENTSTNTYVVCMHDSLVRDAQILDLSKISDEALYDNDISSVAMEDFWFDANITPFIGIYNASTEIEACQKAAQERKYDIKSLFAIKVNGKENQ